MSYNINAVVRRVVLSGSAGTGPYAFSFEIISNTDVEVYKDTTKLTLTTDYAVTINANGTGSVALNTGTTNVPNAPTSANTITIIGSRDIERTTDFVTAGDLTASSLNEQLDSLTIFDQQISERVDRALIGNRSDPLNLSMELPAVDSRKGKYLQFNSSTGAPEAGASSSDATTLASIASDIANLADIEDGTVATDAISGLAAIKANVTTVAGISGNVTTVAGIASNVTTVAGQTANLTNVTNNLSAIQGAAQAASDASDSATAAAASASSLNVGISENNTLQADAGLVDDDFLRIKGTKIEGRSAAELLADIGAITAAAQLTSINGGQIGGSRNIITNGNMVIAQRGTSVTGVSGGGYETVDRFRTAYNGTPDQLRVTHAQVADAPAGFTNSFKLTVTTEEDALASDERVRFQQRIEAFNLQQLAFGTSSASPITLSFYVKSSIAGTYGVDLKNSDASRSAAQSYTISSADTWEKKTLTFAGDTAGAFNNDNGEGLVVSWVLAAGTDYTSGTLATAFASTTNANLAPSGQENLIGTDNATWQITGVQLEAGVATPFEHESYASNLQKCQRYYNRLGFMKHQFYSSSASTTNPDLIDTITFPPMRDAPAANPYTDANYSSSGSTNTTDTTLTLSDIGISSLISQAQRTSSGAKTVRTSYYLELVSEL